MLIDAHCHLDHWTMDEASAFLQRLGNHQLEALIAAAPGAKNWPFYATLAEKFPALKVCYGIHPLDISDRWEEELDQLWSFLKKGIAVGEIGLDFHRLLDNEHIPIIKRQMKVFERQLRCAKILNLPVVIHCRNAFPFVKEILLYTQFDISRVMFHCFVEDVSAAQWIRNNGGYVSYSGVLTFKKPGHTVATAAFMPLSQIFIETDSPYLAPVPYRGKQNSPEYVHYVAQKLAEIKGISYEECVRITAQNVHRFFRF